MIKKENGKWMADIRIDGANSKRYRKSFTTQAEAKRWVAWMKTNRAQKPEWEPPKKSQKRLSELIERWHDLHGQKLRDGEARKTKLLATAERLGNPIGQRLHPAEIEEYRSYRLASGISVATLNRETAYLRAVFSKLIELQEWESLNPLSRVKQLPEHDRELSFLSSEQVTQLLHQVDRSNNPSLPWVVRLSLATGARWSEAESTPPELIGTDRVSFYATKSGRSRTVPITPSLATELRSRAPFQPCYNAFRHAVKSAAITLPRGQLTHLLRHTFASHYVQAGGSLLTLQRLLGHSSLTMTLRYAHLAPNHLEEARRLNPLALGGHLMDTPSLPPTESAN